MKPTRADKVRTHTIIEKVGMDQVVEKWMKNHPQCTVLDIQASPINEEIVFCTIIYEIE